MGRNLKLVDNNKKHFTKEELEDRKAIEDKASLVKCFLLLSTSFKIFKLP
jgi:hypothetical protein